MAGKRGPSGLTAIKSYAQKFAKRQALEDQVEKLKLELKALEPFVLSYFERNGIDRQSIDGRTVAPRHQLWASRNSERSQTEMHGALIAAGLKEYATESMNHQSMSAYVREIWKELQEQEAEKPREEQRLLDVSYLLGEITARHPELDGILEIREELKISVTKSQKSAARGRIKDVMAANASP